MRQLRIRRSQISLRIFGKDGRERSVGVFMGKMDVSGQLAYFRERRMQAISGRIYYARYTYNMIHILCQPTQISTFEE